MLYTKPMIDLVFQIRREAPKNYRPHIKFTNPDLLPLLRTVGEKATDDSLRAAVERLLLLAGEAPVNGQPITPSAEPPSPERGLSRLYRGQRVAS